MLIQTELVELNAGHYLWPILPVPELPEVAEA